MSKLQFRLAYRTDAAGKYNPTAPLEGNEDNMFIDANLSSPEHGSPMADNVIDLSEKGCLMVVADGMGGMNAGEVASEIAIKTVTEYFDNEHMKDKVFRDSRSRMNYMEDVVVAADAAIKADARVNKEHEGMGSTIIMGWLCDDEICLTWCGDSRAYLFRPGCGFWQVSKDHSYVQGLVDEGKITMDEAFDHPYGNIITRSLGDPEKKAKADSVNFKVYEGDIFMLCSDGLSGVLRDHKTFVGGQRIDTENLQDIIAANRASMAQCRDELFVAAERNDWYDNVTAILCEIVSGQPLPAELKALVQAAPEPSSVPNEEPLNYTEVPNPVQPNNIHNSRITIRKKNLPILIAVIVVLLGAVGFLTWKLLQPDKPEKYDPKADNTMFQNCKTGNDYRAYMKTYPKGVGVNYELAKSRLEDWVRDSMNQIANNNLTPAEPAQPTVETPKKNEERKEVKKEEKKEEVPNPGEKTPTDEDWNRGTGIPSEPNDPSQGLTPNDPSQGLTPNDPSQGLTPNNPSQGLNPAKGGLKRTISDPNSEEEAYQRATGPNATLEDCLYWMDKYGDANTRDKQQWRTVKDRFYQLYSKKLRECTTVQDVEKFIDEHEGIMKRARLAGTDGDRNMKKSAEEKKKSLEYKP